MYQGAYDLVVTVRVMSGACTSRMERRPVIYLVVRSSSVPLMLVNVDDDIISERKLSRLMFLYDLDDTTLLLDTDNG